MQFFGKNAGLGVWQVHWVTTHVHGVRSYGFKQAGNVRSLKNKSILSRDPGQEVAPSVGAYTKTA